MENWHPKRPERNIFMYKKVCGEIDTPHYAHLYSLEKDDIDYILETFPVVKRKDIAKYGSYRTKETILQLYDAFAWVREEMNNVNLSHKN